VRLLARLTTNRSSEAVKKSSRADEMQGAGGPTPIGAPNRCQSIRKSDGQRIATWESGSAGLELGALH
jgi:hypothetical protein